MKKVISALLLLVMCCALLTGCMCKHEWQDATCTTPTTCSLCNKTEGDALGHIESDPVMGTINLDSKSYESHTYCRICDVALSSDTVTLTSSTSGGNFVFTPNQFNDIMTSHFDGDYSFDIDTLDSGSLISMIYSSSGTLPGSIMYLNSGESLQMSDVDSANCNGMICYWYTDDNAEIITIMQGILRACDISFDDQSALDTLGAIIDAYGGSYGINGISYEVTTNEGDFVFIITVD